MSESENNRQGESFAEMLDAYEADFKPSVQVGEKVKGKIIDIGESTVFLDTGTKIDGSVEKAELLNEEGELVLSVGDEVELYVIAVSGEGIVLSKAISGIGGAEMLRDAFENRIPVEGKVAKTCKGGFDVEVLHRRAFCPVSQIDSRFVENPEEYVGQTLQFYITTFERDGRNIVLSRRKLLEEQQQESQQEFLQSVSEGDEVTGKVTRLESFGAFIELAPGLEGMAHISELGYARVDDPSEAVQSGDTVTAKVLSVEPGKKPGQMRISLSLKQAMADPWDTITDLFEPGQKIEGKVTRLAKFGAFVEVAPGIEGLVHISEMSYTQRVHKAEDIVEPGQMVAVKIKDIDTEKRRLGLSIKDAAGDPWVEVAEKYKAGTTVTGVVEKREDFGLFISIEPGVTGLMPKSLMAKAPEPAALDKLKVGDEVQAKVQRVDPQQRRMSLSPIGAEESDDWKAYAPEPKAADTSGGMNTLGDLLQQAMKDK